jgi:hypothetical protein
MFFHYNKNNVYKWNELNYLNNKAQYSENMANIK